MSYVDDLRAAAQNPTAAWHQFTLLYKPAARAIFLFVEGELDVPFYVSAAKQIFGDGTPIHDLRCGGRDGVLDAWARVHKTHPSATQCLFLIDKDFTDFLARPTPVSDDLFCTSCYSVENYATGEEALRIIWTHCWLLPSADARYDVVLEHFRRVREAFYRKMTPLMAWIVAAKHSGMRPNVNNIRLSKLIEISRELRVRLLPNAYHTLRKATNCDFAPCVGFLRATVRRFDRTVPQTFIRGKFDMDFFAIFLRHTYEMLKLTTKPLPDGSVQLTPQSIMIALAGKIALPSDLRCFLEQARWRVDGVREGA